MIGLLQRVSEASVSVDGELIGKIDRGLLVLLGVEKHDTVADAVRLSERIAGYRVFADQQGKMNLSVSDIGGGMLIVPQFTLAADTTKGMRPGFQSAAAPDLGQALFESVVTELREKGLEVATGRFGADMQVGLVNDGPVTFWLQVTGTAAR